MKIAKCHCDGQGKCGSCKAGNGGNGGGQGNCPNCKKPMQYCTCNKK